MGAGAAKNMRLLYRLLEDKKDKEIVHLLLFFRQNRKFLWLYQIILLFYYISCS